MGQRHEFWLVWNVDGSAPRFKHETLLSAEREASRLARAHPGQAFAVLHAVSGFIMPQPGPERIEFVEDDGIPF